jgi:glycine/D-amino acid oxidase-like deaminating enzyme
VDRDAIVVGGGFFGCSLALMLAQRGARVLVLEREPDLLLRASTNNQARVHQGYHYPRSILTGLRSRVNYPRFVAEFKDCIDGSWSHFYAVASRQSHVTARQFETFCRRIEAPLRKAPPAARKLFNPELIEELYEVEEVAFDAARLREALRERLLAAGVAVRVSAEVKRLLPPGVGAGVGVELASGEGLQASRVFNCTYAGLNQLLFRSGAEPIPLSLELAELCIVETPPQLRHAGITVMCGPFFSLMPFPSLAAHSFSHVRYTPHCSWEERTGEEERPAVAARASHFEHMKRDAQRYVPLLGGLRLLRSLWELKTLLPQSAHNDARPILFKPSARLPGLISVMGGKLDNVYDLPKELELLAS